MQPDTAPLSIVIADDHPFFRDGLRIMLEKSAAVKIVLKGEASDGEELLQLVNKTRPDIVITDIIMPRTNGIAATRKIKEQSPATEVIAISMIDESSLVLDMFEAGAKGYLLKNAPKDEIIRAIEVVRNKGVYFSNASSKKMISAIVNTRHNPHYTPLQVTFNHQEITIMRLICQQLTIKEMAEVMKISTRTVEDYRYRLQEKISAKCAVGIALYAIRHGLVRWEEL